MSISQFFNRKARAIIASAAFAFGAIGGYAGYQVAEHTGAQPSNYTLNQTESISEDAQLPAIDQDYFPAKLPAGIVISQASVESEAQAIVGFTTRIGQMAQLKNSGGDVTAQAVSFVNDLRLSNDLSEQDYGKLVKLYNAQVGVDVTAQTGNWQGGVKYMQEARAAVEIFGSGLFGGDDEDKTPAQKSADIGGAMAEGQKITDLRDGGGVAGGAILGGLLLVPAWLGIRRKYPKVEEGAKKKPSSPSSSPN